MPEMVEVALPDGDAPSTYTLSPGEGIAPETIEATFDGGGAAVDFLPCCTIYAPDGRKISRTFPAAAMTAGDYSGVTFAPF
jgi:hypothetical protein